MPDCKLPFLFTHLNQLYLYQKRAISNIKDVCLIKTYLNFDVFSLLKNCGLILVLDGSVVSSGRKRIISTIDNCDGFPQGELQVKVNPESSQKLAVNFGAPFPSTEA